MVIGNLEVVWAWIATKVNSKDSVKMWLIWSSVKIALLREVIVQRITW